MRSSNQRGFTLLELLVVVVIIGVLASVAIPQYNSYRTKAEIASAMSNCRSLYRAFTIFYLENDYQYPSMTGDGNTDDFDLDTFFPLIDPGWLGGMNFEIDINHLKKNVGGNWADRVYVADGSYQQYYLIMPWGKDPTLKFIVASSAGVKDTDGVTDIDGGNYIDGVFTWHKGQLKYQ